MPVSRRSQQQRRQTTRGVLLESATRLFGERGYADTALDDIALDCGLTIGAIYHHFGNKKALFGAVNEAAEQRIIDCAATVEGGETLELLRRRWHTFLALCDEPGFRRIVLIDSPNILGRDRWVTSAVNQQLDALIGAGAGDQALRALSLRMLRGAMAEAALAIADADNAARERALIAAVVDQLLTAIAAQLSAATPSLQTPPTEER